MQYHDGSPVFLGDIVRIPVSGTFVRARVVMLGATYEHLDIDPQFLTWVTRDRVLDADRVVLEYLDANPFTHDDPKYAPVGNYMFSPLDESVTRSA